MYQTLSTTYIHKRRLAQGPNLLSELAADQVKEESDNVVMISCFLFVYFAVALVTNTVGAVIYSGLKTGWIVALYCVGLVLDVFGVFTASLGFYSISHKRAANAQRFMGVSEAFCTSYVLSWAFEIAISFKDIDSTLSNNHGLKTEQTICLMGISLLILSLASALVYNVAKKYYLTLQDWRAYTPNNDGDYRPPMNVLDR